MKIDDLNKINSLVEHYQSLNEAVEILKADKDYVRMTLDCNDGFRTSNAKFGVVFKASEAQELYHGFKDDLLGLLQTRKKKLQKILLDYDFEFKPSELLEENTTDQHKLGIMR